MSSYDSSKYKAWYALNASKKRAYSIAYYAGHREAKVAYAKANRLKNPRFWVKSHRKRLYGLEDGDFERLLAKQEGRCAICGIEFDNRKKSLKPHIDHDHKTGLVRGLLCHPCNMALGHVEKDGFLPAALRYLGNK